MKATSIWKETNCNWTKFYRSNSRQQCTQFK